MPLQFLINNNHIYMHPLLIPHGSSYISNIASNKLIVDGYNPKQVHLVPKISEEKEVLKVCTLPPINISPQNNTKDATESIKKNNFNANILAETIISVDITGRRRQRSGPSCDYCRSKKTKCDAGIDVLYQDNDVVQLITDKLHYVFEGHELYKVLDNLNHVLSISEKRIEEIKKGLKFLVKHLDKIILFEPCTCCSKMKPKTIFDADREQNSICKFSNGLTRRDIGTFAKIIHLNQFKKPISNLNIKHYERAGYL